MVALAVCSAMEAQTKLSWSGYLPGGWSDVAEATAVDNEGNVWVVASSSSSFDAPGPNDAFQKTNAGKTDVYVAKYHPEADGRATLLFFTWIGGTGDDFARAIAFGADGRVYITGVTDSTDFPIRGTESQSTNGGLKDAFVCVIDTTVSGDISLLFSSYYGGAGEEEATAIAVNSDGRIFVVGHTNSESLPGVSGNAQGNGRGGIDAFLARFYPYGDAPLEYATYYGGGGLDIATGVAIAPNGLVWFTGYTSSTDFPATAGSHRTDLAAAYDAFLVALDTMRPGLDAIQYGTYFGGNASDVSTAVKIDAAGRIWIAGYTLSDDLPIASGAAQPNFRGGSDAFVARFTLGVLGYFVDYSTYYGGSKTEVTYGFTLMDGEKFALTGYQLDGDLPITGDPLWSSAGIPFTDAFVAIIDSAVPGSGGITYASYLGGEYDDVGMSVSYAGPGALYLSGYTKSWGFPRTDDSGRLNPPGLPGAFVSKITQ